MEKSEYFVGEDGNLYYGGCAAGLLYPITSIGEIVYCGVSMNVESTGGIFMVDKSIGELSSKN